MINFSNIKICVIGLGYVGLPLAIEFSKKYKVQGFDINQKRIADLKQGNDSTMEVLEDERDLLLLLDVTSKVEEISTNNVFIITVPTPIDLNNQPDLSPLLGASQTVGSILKTGDIVIFESTVYPGATEEDCVPVLEKASGLKFNKDFFVGYSPERINPGDKEHRLPNIKKVTSGSDQKTAAFVDELYKSIIVAGTFKASSIKIAEAAKVIENTQRDINIALINELAMIFNKLEIDTKEVLDAAGSKWNFLPFRPGLVGGHCIGVDPYYLTHKALKSGHHPEMILAGRRINDSMSDYIVSTLIKKMISFNINIQGSSVLILGLTFKENCPDIRNTKVINIYRELRNYNINVDIYDPLCSSIEVKESYDIDLISEPASKHYDSIVIAVPHKIFSELGIQKIKEFGNKKCIIYDLKHLFKKEDVDLRL